ncbi:iron uptake cluster protein [Daedaleopsis nitida]|nr:iron uptake cluster protein [Daedaleopsis nitida]
MVPANRLPSKTVAILGASYGGARAAHLLAQGLPQAWRVVLVDRNSHMNHQYVLPRYAVLPGHEHKAFIPYTNPFPEHGISDSDRTLHFDFLVYALGSHLPSPINLWGPVADGDVDKADVLDVTRGTKAGGIAWLKSFQKRIERASSVLVVGGGALGIQYATDIAEIHPATKVTLLHSRHRLLPRYDEAMHSEIISSLSALNVHTVLGDRLDLSSLSEKKSRNGERVVRTQSGREIAAELVLLCTGQTPNTALLREAFPSSVIANGPDKGMARVRRTMQLAEPVPVPVSVSVLPEEFERLALSGGSTPELSPPSDEPAPAPVEEDPHTRVAAEHVFAIGDAADAFGAVNAGHNAFFQGEVAARNIIALAKRTEAEAGCVADTDTDALVLEKYTPGAPAIKVSLGLTKSVYQFQGVIGTRDQEQADLDVHLIWRYFGFRYAREDLETDPEAPRGS